MKDLVKTCLDNKFDGIVLRQTVFDEEARNVLQLAKKAGKEKLIIMSEGSQISTGEQVEERLKAGASLTTTLDPFFL